MNRPLNLLATNLGEDHSEALVGAYLQLGTIHNIKNNVETARDYLSKAEAMLERIPADSIAAAGIYYFQGQWDMFDGRFDSSEEKTKIAYEIVKDNPEAAAYHKASLLIRLANFDMRKGLHEDAEEKFDQALTMTLDRFGENSQIYNLVLDTYSRMLLELGRYAEAEANLVQLLEAYEEQLGATSARAIDVRGTLGYAYLDSGQMEKAHALAAVMLELLETAESVDPVLKTRALVIRSRAAGNLGFVDEALQLMDQAYRLATSAQHSIASIVGTGRNYSELHRAVGSSEQALQSINELLERLSTVDSGYRYLPSLLAEKTISEVQLGLLEDASVTLQKAQRAFSESGPLFQDDELLLLEAESELAIANGLISEGVERLNVIYDRMLSQFPAQNPDAVRIRSKIDKYQSSIP